MRTAATLLAGAAALPAVLAAAAAGQSTGAQDTTRVIVLERLPVTVARGTAPVARLPASITTVGAADIRAGRPTVGIDESLDRVPGVFVNNRYNFSLGTRLSIRGLGARAAFGVRGVRVLADGIPLTMPDGQTNLNNLDLGSADRIEIVRGPASALWGNAAGGVISIESEAPPGRTSFETRVLGGDAGREDGGLSGLFKVQAKAGGAAGEGGWLASLSRMETDGHRAHARAKQTQLNLVGRMPVGDRSRLNIVVNAFDSPLAQSAGALPLDSVRRDPAMAWPNNVRTVAGEATRQVQAGLALAHAIGADRIDVALYGFGRTVDNALPFAYIDLRRQGGGLRASFSGSPRRGRLLLSTGVDLEWSSDERREYNNVAGRPGAQLRRDQQDDVRAFAPFAQALISLGPRADLLFGARYDAVRFETRDARLDDGRDDSGHRTLSAVSPIAGLSVVVTDGLRAYGNVATAFQTPTTTELINAPPPAGQPCCPGGFNTDLEPQRALSFEAGVRGAIGRVQLDAAVYHMRVENTIVPFQVATGEGREFFRNAAQSRHRGVELAASTALGRHLASVAWTLNDFTFVDDGDAAVANEGNQLPGVPRHHIFAGLRLEPLNALRVDLELEHTGRYFASDANDDGAVNDAATTVDLRFLLDLRAAGLAVSPFLALQNLTDTRYNSSVVVNATGRRYYEPAPGRNVILGFSVATGAWQGR